MIAAVAGRQVGAAGDDARFRLVDVPLVRRRIAERLRADGITVVVAAAANGADLLTLDLAAQAGIRRRIVLPMPPELYRTRSVGDRPGSWFEIYDRLIGDAQAVHDLVVVDVQHGEPGEFERGNAAILDEAQRLGREGGDEVEALVIWDGASRGPTDHTNTFIFEAARRGLAVRAVSTLP